jgi:hypothetical protein
MELGTLSKIETMKFLAWHEAFVKEMQENGWIKK